MPARLLPLVVISALLGPAHAQSVVRNGDFSSVADDGLPSGWRLITFHQSPRPSVAVITAEGRRACELTFPTTSRNYCGSLYQPLATVDTDGDYVARFACRATGTGSGDISLAVSGGPGCSLPCSRAWHVPARDGKWHDVELRLPARALKPEGTVLELCFNNAYDAGDTVAIADLRLDFQPDAPVTISCTNPPSGVVFTDAPEQTLTGVVHVPRAHAGRTATVALSSAAGPDEPLQTVSVVTQHPRTAWELDLSGRPVGKYLVTATLAGQDGAKTSRDQVSVWRLDPVPSTSRVIDGKVYVGGEPVVLLGTYHVADWIADVTNKESARIGAPAITRATMLDGLAAQGFDTFLYTNGIPPEDYLADTAARGLTAIPAMAGVGRDWGGAPIGEQVPPVADDPRIVAWAGCDEPTGQTMKGAVEVYRDLKSVSPHKLVISSFNDPSPLQWLDGEATPADLILMDIYTIFKPNVDLSWVGKAVREAAKYAETHPGIAVGVAPQAFIFGGGPEPTPQQLRAQIYLGLVNGARAFFPYAYAENYGTEAFSDVPGQPAGMSRNPARQHWWLPDSLMWDEIPRIASELRELRPVILADGGEVGEQIGEAAIQWLARVVDGVGTLVAVNPRAEPGALQLRLPGGTESLEPLFGSPTPALDGERLELTLGAYGVGVYRFMP